MLLRDIGPIHGVPTFFFGHESHRRAAAAVDVAERNSARAFDVTRDIQAGNLVAVRLHDEDARQWGRCFDVALVEEVCAEPRGGELKVSYYECDGVEAGGAPREEEQLDRLWRRGVATGYIDRDSVICPMWVEPPREGYIWEENKRMLLDCLEHLRQ